MSKQEMKITTLQVTVDRKRWDLTLHGMKIVQKICNTQRRIHLRRTCTVYTEIVLRGDTANEGIPIDMVRCAAYDDIPIFAHFDFIGNRKC